MLEGLVAWVLNNYLGKYVHLNTDQLSIALLSGKVELENVPLRNDALRHLGLPIQVKAGFIGKVQLQIPVRQIRSAPWVIAFEQLYLVASPLPVDEWDHVSEQIARHELKISALDNLEAKWRLDQDIQDANSTYYASSYSSWYSYGAGLVSDIVENLQLKIQDVHIRYEDCLSVNNCHIAFGITIDSLAAQSCDLNWIPGFIQLGKSDHSFKLLELHNFAIYWTTLEEGESLSGVTVAQLAEQMCPAKTKRNTKHYIVSSVSAQAHIKRNLSTQPLRSSDTPRIICDLLLEEVPLTLVDWQYNQIVTCFRGLDKINRLRSYRRYKPNVTIKEDARAWWLYAISCFYPGRQPAICRPRPTWESCLTRARQNVNYVEICKKLLAAPTVALTTDEKKEKDEVEWDREYDELKTLREITMNTVVLPDRNHNNGNSSKGRSMLESWFPQWMGWYSSSTQEASVEPSVEAKELEGEILEALADSVENNTILKRDAVFGQFNFCLRNGTLNLCTVDNGCDESAPMLELEFKNLSLNILSKPRTSSHLVELSLGALYLKDKITRNTMFPILVGPPGQDRGQILRVRGPSPRSLSGSKLEDSMEQLFYLAYEKKPQNYCCDYRLSVRSKCLDVVYQPNAVRWLTDFIFLPLQRDITQSRIEAMKSRTKKEFLKNWENILEGRSVARTTWELELNISAPQIIFVEDFTDQNSAVAVIDFGRLHLLRNNVGKVQHNAKPEFITKESEEDEMFLTPCSTPPASENSLSDEQTLEQNSQFDIYPDFNLDETNLHDKIYECYCLELTDMQILIGKAKDNWRYALNKGSSPLHIIDRFNISLNIERRVVCTSDPHYPSLTLNANLPKLGLHLNENKITSSRNLIHLISSTGLPSPFQTPDNLVEIPTDTGQDTDDSVSMDTSAELSRLLMIQFTVDQMSLELQSRGRCVAELQVAGVRLAFAKRPVDTSITLTVHSLLLVDALQTFGPDFELLVASHKHVGMDSVSGSLRDSEPTSPTSPASPDPSVTRVNATSPIALTQALSSLSTSPPRWPLITRTAPFIDSEALISLEVVLVSGNEPIQIANIQFNNLDIIANQETIVELMGFIKRVFPMSQKQAVNLSSVSSSRVRLSSESLLDDLQTDYSSTELTFDFHRLNILLLRGVVRDGLLYGKKICTATMTEAKIRATVSNKLEVEGSLGGLQVLDLTPEGHIHQRIVSVGRDPLIETPHPIYMMSTTAETDEKAFSFKFVRSLETKTDKDVADVTIRMASLWYTHSPQFIVELQSCATEFKQYLANLARSIRSAATDMALGLVHARAEALAQSLNMNKRLPSSIYGSTHSISESSSPSRRRRRSSSNEPSGFFSARDTVPQTPYSPADDDKFIIDLNLDIELNSPVVVLPRSSSSTEVFVAHLGKISVSNKYVNETLTNGFHYDFTESRVEHYDIDIKDMNVYSLDTSSRRVPGPMISKPEVMYSCKTQGKPILHDTMVQLNIDREMSKSINTRNSSESDLLLDDENDVAYYKQGDSIQLSGTIVTALKVSLTRAQYEQLLDTVQWLTTSPKLSESHGISRVNIRPQPTLTNISEEEIGVTTLNMDPHVRAKLFPNVNTLSKSKSPAPSGFTSYKVNFEVPMLTIELRGDGPSGEQGLVDLSFNDFIFNYEKCHLYETNIQVSLKSIFMEDLLQPEDSRQRCMVISSSSPEVPFNTSCVSRSCPDVTEYFRHSSPSHGSLPDHLEPVTIFGMGPVANHLVVPPPVKKQDNSAVYPSTPPPSPSLGRSRPEKNLVLISTLLVDPAAPNFDSFYNSTHSSTSIDFNCLDLVISVPSWVVVIDFFGGMSSDQKTHSESKIVTVNEENMKINKPIRKAVTNITVCSLTVVLVKPELDIAKANISNADFVVKTSGLKKEVNGKLGSMSLLDLTLHGQLYRERFVTSEEQALQFIYVRHPPSAEKGYDAQLTINMASVMYVHTKRFVAEIQAFFSKFTERQQTVMKGIQTATSGKVVTDEPFRLSLRIEAGSPIILLPVSSKSSDALVIDLGQLSVVNTFKFAGDEGTISVLSDMDNGKKCQIEVMTINLDNMDLYSGIKQNDVGSSSKLKHSPTKSNSFKLGSSFIMRKGPSLLAKKFQLKLQYEKNLHKNTCHLVPDSSIYGHLSTLDCALDIHQYKMIRGLLAFNLGEDTERIYPSVQTGPISAKKDSNEEWILSSIKLEMQNVSLRLLKSHSCKSPLTCINFIKSHLTVETFSNLSQDIDLVSQEILVMDTRFHGCEPSTSNYNVFTNILQPIKYSTQSDLVQAEIHSRRRQDHTKVTILLNNMRLMAIFHWWEAVREYIFQEIENVPTSPEHVVVNRSQSTAPSSSSFELKMNITDSELVLVEDSSQWDSNAVILKSTTVLKYRPNYIEKPLSCSLNNCEMFSCILGMENETALSIIDPITLSLDIVKEGVLEVQLQFLTVRLSYHDMCMFRQMLNSLPKQLIPDSSASTTQTPVIKSHIATLTSLGFKSDDCIEALEKCNNRLDDAALWLTHNATPSQIAQKKDKGIFVSSIEVKANCISVCIIDDCGDSDVPLLEISFTDLELHQLLPELNVSDPVYPQGYLYCSLTSDYYNRVLSGWEPVLEPWNCKLMWEKSLSQNLLRNRLLLKVESEHTFNINITSTLTELYRQVKENWTKDYYNVKQDSVTNQNRAIQSFRRRSPFVPFALKNETGSTLKFITHISDLNASHTPVILNSDDNWIVVEPGQTVPFSFTCRDKLRHQNSHKLRMHQLSVKVEGWQFVDPVTVDKVGTFFRDTPAEIQSRVMDIPPARIVFDVALEGSSRKLVTVRSALLIMNELPHMIEVKLESKLPHDSSVTLWVPSKTMTIEPKAILSVPLDHSHSQINVRPTGLPHQFTFCMPSLTWCKMPFGMDRVYELGTCHSHKGQNFRFCAEIIKEKVLIERSARIEQPAHRIILVPAIKLVNLLPMDLNYNFMSQKGHVKAGQSIAILSVDPEQVVELDVKIESFKTCSSVFIPAGTSDFSCRIKLEDSKQRKLYLLVEIAVNKGAKLKITISSPFWIINKTGLPLVFKQSGTSIESAGQFDEHEQARMVAPLLFSFSDQDASQTINARVGKKVVWDGTPQWCANFPVRKGTQYRKLHVTMRDSKPDTVFVVGIEVRTGRGKYRNTHIVTISPRYQLHNRSSYQLAFAQVCAVKNSSDTQSQRTCLKAMPNSYMPFHWSRLDKDQLLCVSIQDIPDCCWSGGLKIDTNNSMHVNVRDVNGRVYFLRLEVVLQGATFYIVFTDADTMPPPIRVDNFSDVSIKFGQSCYIDIMHSIARAHSSVPYAWDEPTKTPSIKLVAPGGVSNTYNMNHLGTASGLTYENFIYIAFVGTFKNCQSVKDPHDVESQQLVLDVLKNRVFLAHKIPGERSQLWRMTSEGYLQHEGSSPPNHPSMPRSKENILVLDIDNTAPRPDTYTKLTLKRVDPRRQSTQKWRFGEDGRLCCQHSTMCVQAEDGFYGLRPGSAAVLGLPQPICHKVTDKGIPIEQGIERQRLRPGSGFLSVNIEMDGPTQVITIKDLKEKKLFASPDDREWGTISQKQRPRLALDDVHDKIKESRELQFNLNVRGIGISLICRRAPEELLYAHFSDIVAETVVTPQHKQFCISIKDVQVDNQLLDTTVPVVLYVTPPGSRSTDEAYNHLPAIDFNAEIQEQLNENAVIFKHLILRFKKLTTIIEEKLLLKLFAFIGFHSQEEELVNKGESDYETQRLVTEVSAAHAKRYYFGVLKLIPDEIRLSVRTATKLSKHLQQIKKKLSLTLIKFEDAAIVLQPFDRKHPFETSQFLFKSIMKHFKEELMWQAGVILGSVDFIGNPLGLVNDVSEGISGFLDGNVGALVKNVTHGLSNSAAKVTESLSDGLGKMAMDDYHEEMRQRIRQVESGRSSDHILAGIKGLGFGLLGGTTSIFKQVYEGASNDGLPGVFSGLGKGVVGAFTKPVVGVLDFASETARAVRDSSKSKLVPERKRLPRCVYGPGGLLPRYSAKQNQGQQFLYIVNDKNHKEKLVAYQVLGSASEDLICIVSNKSIRIITSVRAPELTPVLECPLSDLETCNVIKEKESGESRYYIEIVMHYTGASSSLLNPDPVKKPRVRCRSHELAMTTAEQINYAKRLYTEYLYTISDDNITVTED